MSSLAISNFPSVCCPSWFAPVPKKTKVDQEIKGDWCNICVIKRDDEGKIIRSFGIPEKFKFTQEISTGDLYGVQEEGLIKPHLVAAKAIGMFCAAPFYAIGVMAANLIKIAIDISSIFWRIIPQMIHEIFIKGPIAALGNALMGVMWDVPISVLQNGWRVGKSSIYMHGIMIASLYTLITPFEGRKWIAKIEKAWHEGASYRMDLRYGKSEAKDEKVELGEMIADIKAGKFFFLGYCMQKRGNLSDIVAGKKRFELYKKEIVNPELKSPSWFWRFANLITWKNKVP